MVGSAALRCWRFVSSLMTLGSSRAGIPPFRPAWQAIIPCLRDRGIAIKGEVPTQYEEQLSRLAMGKESRQPATDKADDEARPAKRARGRRQAVPQVSSDIAAAATDATVKPEKENEEREQEEEARKPAGRRARQKGKKEATASVPVKRERPPASSSSLPTKPDFLQWCKGGTLWLMLVPPLRMPTTCGLVPAYRRLRGGHALEGEEGKLR